MTGNTGHKDQRFHRLEQGAALPDQPFVALVDGAKAPLLALDLPDGLRGQARERVARLQISDGIGLSPEQIELRPFAAKPHVTPWTHVMITAPDQVADWRSLCDGAGARCQAILPDYLSLPVIPEVWTIATTATTTTARLGLEDGFSCEHELALALLAKAPKPKAVFRLGVTHPPLEDLFADLALPVCRSKAELAARNLPAPKVLAHGELAFDLRQNPTAAFEQMRASLRAWRTPVVLAVLALGLWSASTLLSLRGLQARAVATRVATVAEVRKSFVPNGPVLDIRAQVSQSLAARQAQTGSPGEQVPPLALFKAATLVLQTQAARLITASFSPANGLSLALLLPDFSSLDQVVAALEKDGIAVQVVESSSAEEGGVNGILLLQAKGQDKK